MGTFVLVLLSLLFDTSCRRFKDLLKINNSLTTRPIISVYVPTANQTGICNSSYEAVSFHDDATIRSISGSPWPQFGDTKCSGGTAKSGCRSSLPAVSSNYWRQSHICIKRSGIPAISEDKSDDDEVYRTYQCPAGYKKCGTGWWETPTICFPGDSLCPITNMKVLSHNEPAPNGKDWESAGSFPDKSILYVHRDHTRNEPREMPIFDILVRLTEFSAANKSIRGPCFQGPSQVLNAPLVADSNTLWSYSIKIPRACDIVDARYHLFDSVSLEDHFLQNLHLTEPTCRKHDLYAVSDPKYQSALDPDYLNSGIKCSMNASRPCMNEPNDVTVCSIEQCIGVKHQNICGAYVHAVRTAFAESTVQLGLYFARETSWHITCLQSINFNMSAALFVFVLSALYFVSLCWWIRVCVYIFTNSSLRTISCQCKVTVFLLCLPVALMCQVCVFSWTSLAFTKIVFPESIDATDCMVAYDAMLLSRFNTYLFLTVLVLICVVCIDQVMIIITNVGTYY